MLHLQRIPTRLLNRLIEAHEYQRRFIATTELQHLRTEPMVVLLTVKVPASSEQGLIGIVMVAVEVLANSHLPQHNFFDGAIAHDFR